MKNIAKRLDEIRLYNTNFNTEENREIVDAFYELGEFVIKNFKIPSTHIEYINKHLGIVGVDTYSEFILKYEHYKGKYSLELPLRAIECYFLWSEEETEDYSLKTLMKLKFLISKLHHLVGVGNKNDEFNR
ncbi:hypothetical protein ACI75Y_06890 [Capnocytophaga stomatis]|uniref:hypothetical protein n=2 Tax=Flavobacteriaceae TaxID=49546 RepID=UPI00385877B6